MIGPEHYAEGVRFLFWTVAALVGIVVTISIIRTDGNGARIVMLLLIVPPTIAFVSLAVGVYQKIVNIYTTDWLMIPAVVVCLGWSCAFVRLKRL